MSPGPSKLFSKVFPTQEEKCLMATQPCALARLIPKNKINPKNVKISDCDALIPVKLIGYLGCLRANVELCLG